MTARPVVSVFGSASVPEGSPLYDDGMRLGSGLAQSGFDVATGGYGGLMEAVSRGASEGGAHVLGFTCDRLEVWRPVQPNAWIHEQIRCSSLRERVVRLIEAGQALVALPGGVGTLSEIALSWSMLQTGELTPRPMLLVGEAWRRTIDEFLERAATHVRPADVQWVTLVPDVDAALTALPPFGTGR